MENIQQLIAEAEERGYIRGRNEQIEQQMQTSTGLWQDPSAASPPPDDAFPILTSPRPSIWDQ